jgi:2-deoxy-D-gluconate 3-dehydrogenase
VTVLDNFRLDGRTALVTGAATGLGAAMAIALAEAGATVACHGNRRTADHTVASILASGGNATAFFADLGESTGAEQLFSDASRLGSIDILVNNAGTIHRSAAEEFAADDWERVLQVNLTSMFRLCQLAGKPMLERRSGKIVNVASLLSFQGGIQVSAYAASKGGVAQLTKALANEWAGRNVNVNAIAPGYFRTENTSALQADEIRNGQILERIPAGRWGEPNDLAGAVVFLASNASRYIHGEVLVADGGWMAR